MSKFFTGFYRSITAVEAFLVPCFVVLMTLLVFASAVFRTFGRPLNWAVDMSLLMLAWSVALGGDLAFRKNRIVNVDMIINMFPVRVRKALALLWCAVIMFFLGCLVWYGYLLCTSNRRRIYQTLQIGYIWANASVPVGASLMFVTSVIRFVKIWLDLPLTPAQTEIADPEGGVC